MHHIQVIGYHVVDYWNIAPLELNFNTSGNIFPMLFVGKFPGGYVHVHPLPLLPHIKSSAAGAV